MRVLLLLTAGVLALAPALAQDTRKVVVRTLCFEHVDALKSVQFLQKDSTPVEIPLWLREPSDDIVLKVSGQTLSFHVPATASDAEPRLVARGTIGAGNRQLLFFVPSGKPEAPYRVISFPDDAKSFPMGATRLLNLAKVPAVFHMGERVTKVAPGRSAIVPMPRKLNKYNDYNFEIKLQTTKGLYPVRQTRGRAVKTKRDMAVVYLAAGGQRAKVNLYTDIPPWAIPGAKPE